MVSTCRAHPRHEKSTVIEAKARHVGGSGAERGVGSWRYSAQGAPFYTLDVLVNGVIICDAIQHSCAEYHPHSTRRIQELDTLDPHEGEPQYFERHGSFEERFLFKQFFKAYARHHTSYTVSSKAHRPKRMLGTSRGTLMPTANTRVQYTTLQCNILQYRCCAAVKCTLRRALRARRRCQRQRKHRTSAYL